VRVHGPAFLEALVAARAVAIIRAPLQELAAEAMAAAVRGGFRVVEFTLNTPGALELVTELAKREGLLVGAGTVLTAADAEGAVRAGAEFLVSPVIDDAVLAAAHALGTAFVPGCATPTEMLRAHRAGAAAVKLFPAPGNGPEWVRAVLGPLPELRIVPTQGVDVTNAAAWLAAGAVAVGTGPALFPPEDVAARRWDAIEGRARALLAALRPAR
jgi:Entner-Doudoroff aldolase